MVAEIGFPTREATEGFALPQRQEVSAPTRGEAVNLYEEEDSLLIINTKPLKILYFISAITIWVVQYQGSLTNLAQLEFPGPGGGRFS